MEPRQAGGRLDGLAARGHPAAALILSGFVNHVLRSAAWAQERLAPFAGAIVEVEAPAPLPPIRLRIAEGGLVEPAPAAGEAALKVRFKPEAPSAWLRGKEHFLRAVEVSGDPKFADAALELARELRWDYEEDLSRVIGDVAAHRLAAAAREFVAWNADAARRLGEALADYAAEERKLVVGRAEFDAHAQDVGRLRDGVERLEQRIKRLG
ncbi:MAG TPA: sterol-binding protein [Burkholderiales bacterium]